MSLSPEHEREDEEQEDQRSSEIADQVGAVDHDVGDERRQGGGEHQADPAKGVHLALPSVFVDRGSRLRGTRRSRGINAGSRERRPLRVAPHPVGVLPAAGRPVRPSTFRLDDPLQGPCER
jgi:hypothetical protein